jgi:uncharacterized membrane protein YhfC
VTWGVVLGLAAGAAVSLLLPVAAVLAIRRATGAPVTVALMGAAVFFVSQVVLRLPWQVPLAQWIGPKVAGSWLLGTLWLAFCALGAGVFEEVGRWVGYRRLIPEERSWGGALMFGAGHAGFESVVLVGLSVGTGALLAALLLLGLPTGLGAEAEAALRAHLEKLTPLTAATGGFERILSLGAHLGLSVLVLEAVRRESRALLGAAIGLHALGDFVGVGGASLILRATGDPLLAELAIVPFALAGVALCAWYRPRGGEGRGV